MGDSFRESLGPMSVFACVTVALITLAVWAYLRSTQGNNVSESPETCILGCCCRFYVRRVCRNFSVCLADIEGLPKSCNTSSNTAA